MGNGPAITNVDDDLIISLIKTARDMVFYMAPGVSEPVATAIHEAWFRLNRGEAVQVIIDIDPEVCRLGYGTLEGLQVLNDAANKMGTTVYHQPGIRIGVLICDNTTLIYSPTPLLIEAGSTNQERPNAIIIGETPAGLSSEIRLDEDSRSRSISEATPVDAKRIKAVEADLQQSPPLKFDLARQIRIYTSKFQFVEFTMTGCNISRKRVPIPSDLVGLAREKEIKSQFQAHFNLVEQSDLVIEKNGKKISEKSLMDHRKEIADRYLVPIANYGNIILRVNKEKFEEEVDKLKNEVEAFQEGIKNILKDHVKKNVDALTKALLPAVKQNPPDKYIRLRGDIISEKDIEDFLVCDINYEFIKAGRTAKNMEIKVVFKDVTYESLRDEKFMRRVMEALRDTRLVSESDAVMASGRRE